MRNTLTMAINIKPGDFVSCPEHSFPGIAAVKVDPADYDQIKITNRFGSFIVIPAEASVYVSEPETAVEKSVFHNLLYGENNS